MLQPGGGREREISIIPRGQAHSDRAKSQLAEHRERLDHLAQALLDRETLDEADAYAVARIPQPAATEQPVTANA